MSLLSIDEIKTLVEQPKGLCVSIYMPTYRAGDIQQNPIRFKNVILNGGIVYAVEPEKVPDHAQLAAVFRY